jgi:hypothetical protein
MDRADDRCGSSGKKRGVEEGEEGERQKRHVSKACVHYAIYSFSPSLWALIEYPSSSSSSSSLH